MELSLTWFALVAGLLGWVCCAAVTAPPTGSRGLACKSVPLPKPVVIAAVLFPVAVWLATLPTRPPFSSGQGFGRGFLMGGAAALCAALVIERAITLLGAAAARRWPLACSAASLAPLFAVLPPTAVALLWKRDSIIEALLGIATAWVGTNLILGFGSRSTDAQGAIAERRFMLLTQSSVFVSCLCATVGLGIYRDFVDSVQPRGTYPAIATTLAAAIAIAFLAGALLGDSLTEKSVTLSNGKKLTTSILITAILGVLLPLGFGYLLGLKWIGDLNLLFVIGLGTIIGYFVWWLVDESIGTAPESASNGLPPVAMFIALCAYVFAYQLMQGFGVGLMTLAVWPALLLHQRTSAESINAEPATNEINSAQNGVSGAMVTALAFLTVLLVSRFFAMRFRYELRGTTLTDQYSLFGLLIGAIAPLMIASPSFGADRLQNSDTSNHWHALPAPVRLVWTGLLAIALPIGLVAMWGIKLLPPVFAGEAIAVLGLSVRAQRRTPQVATISVALAISLLCTMWADKSLPLAEASRALRLHYAGLTVGLLIVCFVIADCTARALFRRDAGARAS